MSVDLTSLYLLNNNAKKRHKTRRQKYRKTQHER